MKSSLEIYDLTTGEATAILQTDRLIEAPNWSRDGALIVNGDGRLYRVPLAKPELIEIDTGFAAACNNDHGLSPDGRMLVISDKTETGQSQIYTLPAEGGEPKRITPTGPSYWHGWSPDSETLAYVAKRGEAADFGLYTIPAAGGEERRLTQGGGHHDGPDYTPDGAWIWYNADIAGTMDLWRIRPDGTDRQRMTDGPTADWFPHPSPDGAHVLYLAYAPGTEGHPRDREVELRLMPAEGGLSRRLLGIFGGQGSINVPCWAPDAKRFAFVRYAREKE